MAGGARPGAGRPKKSPEIIDLSIQFDDPAVFLKAVMNDSASDAKLRVDAAKALLRAFDESVGKKDRQKEAAAKAAGGRFAAAALPPRLVVSNSK